MSCCNGAVKLQNGSTRPDRQAGVSCSSISKKVMAITFVVSVDGMGRGLSNAILGGALFSRRISMRLLGAETTQQDSQRVVNRTGESGGFDV